MLCPNCNSVLELETGQNHEFRLYCTNLAIIEDKRYASGKRFACRWASHEIPETSKFMKSMKHWLSILSLEDFFEGREALEGEVDAKTTTDKD